MGQVAEAVQGVKEIFWKAVVGQKTTSTETDSEPLVSCSSSAAGQDWICNDRFYESD